MASEEQTHRDLDAPTPPGSPMRQDAPTADVTPGPMPGSEPEPTSEPGPTSDPDPTSDPRPETQPSQADVANAQAENAGSSLDEPSDNSGSE